MFEVYVLVEKKKSVILSFFSVFSYVMGALSALAVVLGIYFFVPTAVFGIILGFRPEDMNLNIRILMERLDLLRLLTRQIERNYLDTIWQK